MVPVGAYLAFLAPLALSLLAGWLWHLSDAGNDDPRNRHKPL